MDDNTDQTEDQGTNDSPGTLKSRMTAAEEKLATLQASVDAMANQGGSAVENRVAALEKGMKYLGGSVVRGVYETVERNRIMLARIKAVVAGKFPHEGLDETKIVSPPPAPVVIAPAPVMAAPSLDYVAADEPYPWPLS